jgi:hypothetical protein
MPSTDFGNPGDVLAKHIKLKPPVNQRLLWASALRPGLFRAAVIPRCHD